MLHLCLIKAFRVVRTEVITLNQLLMLTVTTFKTCKFNMIIKLNVCAFAGNKQVEAWNIVQESKCGIKFQVKPLTGKYRVIHIFILLNIKRTTVKGGKKGSRRLSEEINVKTQINMRFILAHIKKAAFLFQESNIFAQSDKEYAPLIHFLSSSYDSRCSCFHCNKTLRVTIRA